MVFHFYIIVIISDKSRQRFVIRPPIFGRPPDLTCSWGGRKYFLFLKKECYFSFFFQTCCGRVCSCKETCTKIKIRRRIRTWTWSNTGFSYLWVRKVLRIKVYRDLHFARKFGNWSIAFCIMFTKINGSCRIFMHWTMLIHSSILKFPSTFFLWLWLCYTNFLTWFPYPARKTAPLLSPPSLCHLHDCFLSIFVRVENSSIQVEQSRETLEIYRREREKERDISSLLTKQNL